MEAIQQDDVRHNSSVCSYMFFLLTCFPFRLDIFEDDFDFNDYQADFPPGLTHAILVSSVNEDKKKKDSMPYKLYKSSLIDRLSRDLPSIALCAYSFGGDPLTLFADYVGRRLPLVLIDSRPLPSKVHYLI